MLPDMKICSLDPDITAHLHSYLSKMILEWSKTRNKSLVNLNLKQIYYLFYFDDSSRINDGLCPYMFSLVNGYSLYLQRRGTRFTTRWWWTATCRRPCWRARRRWPAAAVPTVPGPAPSTFQSSRTSTMTSTLSRGSTGSSSSWLLVSLHHDH